MNRQLLKDIGIRCVDLNSDNKNFEITQMFLSKEMLKQILGHNKW